MKVVLVYDRVNKWGGAERVLMALHEIWPEAPLFTSVYDRKMAFWANIFPRVIPSFLQNFPFAKNYHEVYPYLMPLAFESFNFDKFDLVISVTSEAGKGIITKPSTRHICYCLTPTRYLWSGYFHYKKSLQFGPATSLMKFFYSLLTQKLRYWDFIAAQRPDQIISISQNVAERVEKYYHRDSQVIYPPVDTEKFKPSANKSPGEYYLAVSRLVSYKRVDLAIQAFNKLGWKLIVIGTGRQLNYLKSLAKPNITFISQNLTDEKLVSYYQNCKGLLFTADEDLGLVPIEAQACSIPVIAYRSGGALETIIEGQTGEFFDKPTSDSLVKTLSLFARKDYNRKIVRESALRFNKERFRKSFIKLEGAN